MIVRVVSLWHVNIRIKQLVDVDMTILNLIHQGSVCVVHICTQIYPMETVLSISSITVKADNVLSGQYAYTVSPAVGTVL